MVTATQERHHSVVRHDADSWEDCLLVGEGFMDNARHADEYGAPEGATLVSLSDYTDGPRTRVKFYADDPAVAEQLKREYPQGQVSSADDDETQERMKALREAKAEKHWRLRPDPVGTFVVTEHHQTMNDWNACVVMRDETRPGITAAIEKFVPIEMKDTHFAIGRRFALLPVDAA